MTQVKCKIKPCHYYGDGDICTADTILVDCNQKIDKSSPGTEASRMEVGRMDLNLGGFESRANDPSTKTKSTSGKCDASDIKTSEETLCSTFRPKGGGPRH